MKKQYLINQFPLRFVPAQKKMEGWIMDEVAKGVALLGLYPMNVEAKVHCEAWAEEDASTGMGVAALRSVDNGERT